ncbi:MAG: type II and III secretion system protein family protein [Terracidiphilus sp.]
MKATAGNTIACLCAVFVIVCAASSQQADTTPAVPQPAPANIQDSANDLYVAVGKTVLVDTAKPIKRIAIGSAETAETHAINRTEIMVSGKAVGETSLIIWDTLGNRQFFNVKVSASTASSEGSLEAVRRQLRSELPGQNLKVSFDNNIIFLRGTVNNLNSSDRAVKIASTAGKVVNLLDVKVPPADPQILLKVRFISVDRNKAQQLGINLFNNGLGNAFGTISTTQAIPPPLLAATAGTTIASGQNLAALFPGLGGVGASITALDTKGVTEDLAEPNILAVNGKEASFLAGGEYPYPVVQGGAAGTAASVTIMFKEYGIRLNFIPVITPRGTIRLQIAPEVSQLDFADAVDISGFEVPAITSRKMKTEVELGDGQTFVLAGLLNNTETETFEKIPFIGDIPILGKLFQSMAKAKTNTELIVLVTPEIVSPIPAGAPLPDLKFPSKFLPPNSGIPMNNPDAKTADNTPAPVPTAIPVEKLLDSMKPEPVLQIEGAQSGFGSASSGSSSAQTSASPQ